MKGEEKHDSKYINFATRLCKRLERVEIVFSVQSVGSLSYWKAFLAQSTIRQFLIRPQPVQGRFNRRFMSWEHMNSLLEHILDSGCELELLDIGGHPFFFSGHDNDEGVQTLRRATLFATLSRFKTLRHLGIPTSMFFGTGQSSLSTLELPLLSSINVNPYDDDRSTYYGSTFNEICNRAIPTRDTPLEEKAKWINGSLPRNLARKWGCVSLRGKPLLYHFIATNAEYIEVEYYIQTQQATLSGDGKMFDDSFLGSLLQRPTTKNRTFRSEVPKPMLLDWIKLILSALDANYRASLTHALLTRLLFRAAESHHPSLEELLEFSMQHGVTPGELIDPVSRSTLLIAAANNFNGSVGDYYEYNIYQLVKNRVAYKIRPTKEADKFGFTALHYAAMNAPVDGDAVYNLRICHSSGLETPECRVTPISIAAIDHLPELIEKRKSSLKVDFIAPYQTLDCSKWPERLRLQIKEIPPLLLRLAACPDITDHQFRLWIDYAKSHEPDGLKKLDITPLVQFFKSTQQKQREGKKVKDNSTKINVVSEDYIKKTTTAGRRLRMLNDEYGVNVIGQDIFIWLNL